MIILLMGPQGSGKGTMGAVLSKRFGIPTISTGNLLRDEIATGSELGAKIKAIIDPGNLVPPDLATDVMVKRLQEDDVKDGAFLDGYPRDPEQLRLMLEHFTPDKALVLEITDDLAVERLGGRWICEDGHIYHEKTLKPKVEGICDNDGKELYQRDDDKEEAIRVRLGIYHRETEPLIAKIKEAGVEMLHVDASGSVEEVDKRIMEVIGEIK